VLLLVRQVASDLPLNVLVSLPERHGADGPWPVLFFLHGQGEAAPLALLTAATCHGPLKSGSSQRALDFVVVIPQLPAPGGDVWHNHGDQLQRIAEVVCSEYQGDRERKYLCGFSHGGNGVLDLGSKQADVWAALWAVDPTRVPSDPPKRPLFLSRGEHSRGSKWDAFIRNNNLADALASPDGDRIMADEGRNHVLAATKAFTADRVYGWFLKKHR
jgi:hypothetical protein